MDIYHVSKKFPKDEIYSLTTQIRKFSKSVCSNSSLINAFSSHYSIIPL
ncbi:MAG: four helix bundle protein [Bacteroidetes bacterium]|nr:four helix bundle protein [Bacteroidota bacterium]